MAKARFNAISTASQPGGSAILDQVVTNVDTALRELGDIVTNDALVSVTFTGAAVDTRATHKLGFVPRSWEVVDKTANINVWRSLTVNADAKNTMLLQASGAGTVIVRFE